MAVRIVRLGSARAADEGLRVGAVRRPPRGVRKTGLGSRAFYDVWLPGLSPSGPLLKKARASPGDDKSWNCLRTTVPCRQSGPD